MAYSCWVDYRFHYSGSGAIQQPDSISSDRSSVGWGECIFSHILEATKQLWNETKKFSCFPCLFPSRNDNRALWYAVYNRGNIVIQTRQSLSRCHRRSSGPTVRSAGDLVFNHREEQKRRGTDRLWASRIPILFVHLFVLRYTRPSGCWLRCKSLQKTVCRRCGRYGHPEATCYLFPIRKPRLINNLHSRERTSQFTRKSSHETVSEVKASPSDTVATTKSLAVGEPDTEELRTKRMYIERLLNQDK